MTREEAMPVLKEISTTLKSWSGFTSYPQAIDMAIEALQREEAEEKGYCHRIKPKEYFDNDATKPSNDVINRADAIKAVAEHFSFDDGCSNIYKDIDYYKGIAEHILKNVPSALPSAEAVQGEWEHWGSPFSDESEVIDTIVCSACGARFIEPKDEPKGEYNFCPNCGADMRQMKAR